MYVHMNTSVLIVQLYVHFFTSSQHESRLELLFFLRDRKNFDVSHMPTVLLCTKHHHAQLLKIQTMERYSHDTESL